MRHTLTQDWGGAAFRGRTTEVGRYYLEISPSTNDQVRGSLMVQITCWDLEMLSHTIDRNPKRGTALGLVPQLEQSWS